MARYKNSTRTRAATLADVGREAGVSAMAASAVINGAKTSSRISPETRERILEAAARLNYRPNAAARALASRRMNTLGVAAVIEEGGALEYYFLEVFNGILEAAAKFEYSTTVFALHDWGKDPARLSGLCDGRIDGLILIAPTLSRNAAKYLPAHTPFVSLHANWQMPNVVNIESDEERGAYEIVKCLIEDGHKRILNVGGPEGQTGADRRVDGYKKALKEAGIGFLQSMSIRTNYNAESGMHALRQWLKRNAGKQLPDAICCGNDAIAIGVLEVLAEAGIRVPEDISVTGFDDTLAARTTVPQLATVRQPLTAMGKRAVEVLMERINQNDVDTTEKYPNPIVFPVEMVRRASVGPSPAVARLVPAK